jgi:hypothetical protein
VREGGAVRQARPYLYYFCSALLQAALEIRLVHPCTIQLVRVLVFNPLQEPATTEGSTLLIT